MELGKIFNLIDHNESFYFGHCVIPMAYGEKILIYFPRAPLTASFIADLTNCFESQEFRKSIYRFPTLEWIK